MIRCRLRGTEGAAPAGPCWSDHPQMCESKHRTSQLTLRSRKTQQYLPVNRWIHASSQWLQLGDGQGGQRLCQTQRKTSTSELVRAGITLWLPAPAAGRWDEELCRAESKKAALRSRTSGKTFRSAEFNTVQNIFLLEKKSSNNNNYSEFIEDK